MTGFPPREERSPERWDDRERLRLRPISTAELCAAVGVDDADRVDEGSVDELVIVQSLSRGRVSVAEAR